MDGLKVKNPSSEHQLQEVSKKLACFEATKSHKNYKQDQS